MKKLFLKLLLFLPLILAIVGINIWIDPLHLLSNEYYKKAGLLLAENRIEFDDCDERKLLIEHVKHKKDCDLIILGSSRTASIDTGYVENSMLNLSLSAALLEDMIACYGLYISNHNQPKKILIGIDPWTFNGNRNPPSDFLFRPFYNDMLSKIGLSTSQKEIDDSWDYNYYMNIISLEYFQNSLISIWKNGFKRMEPVIYNGNEKISIKDPNGVIHYRKGWQSDPNDVEIALQRELSQKDMFGTDGFKEVSVEKVQILKKFLQHLVDHKIEVILFLSPYHPKIWDNVKSNQKYNAIIESEKIVREIAKEKNINIIGSFNPYLYDLKYMDFYDAVHANHNALKKIFNYKDKKK